MVHSMSRKPTFETTDWFMSQVYPVFWPCLFWSLARFEARCAAIRAAQGEGALVVYHVHWWGWIEISDVWPAEAVKPNWQTKAEAVVAQLLSPVLGDGPEDTVPVWSLEVLDVSPIGRPVPAFQDSS